MTILGIDPSSTAIGLAVIDADEGKFELVDSNALDLKGAKVLDEGAIPPRKRKMSPDERFVELRGWVRWEIHDLREVVSPEYVVIERPQTRFPTPDMMETVGMVRSVLCDFDWMILPPMQATTARKLIGVGGNASKQVAAEYVRKLLGDSAAGLDEHSTDAAAVAIAAWYQLEQAKEAA